MPRHKNGSTARPIEGGVSRTYRKSASAAALDEAMHRRTDMPTSPCGRCGARGFCGHDGRVAELWEA